jgi:NTP pyrophosphatase (non-canonical NTP hydrolase)
LKPPSPWQPENNKLHLAVLGKLGEETNELGSAIFRCVIQGVDGVHPVTGKHNLEALQDEIADVLAGIDIAIDRFGLSALAIHSRRVMKVAHKLDWHKLIKE